MELFIGGGIILIYLGVVIACVLWALSWARRRNFRWKGKIAALLVVLLVAYAIPFGDHTIGKAKFEQLCAKEAGSTIYRTVKGVDGLMWGGGRQAKPYTTYGYDFYETKGKGSQIFRYVRREDGTIDEESDSDPKAKYSARQGVWVATSKHFSKLEFVIGTIDTDEVLARYTTLHYEGGWLTRFLRGIGVGGPTCPDTPLNYVEFIHSVLSPSQGGAQ